MIHGYVYYMLMVPLVWPHLMVCMHVRVPLFHTTFPNTHHLTRALDLGSYGTAQGVLLDLVS